MMSNKEYRIPNIKFEKSEAYNKAYDELERFILALNLTPSEKNKLWHRIKKLNGETARDAKAEGLRMCLKAACKAVRASPKE